MLLRQGTSKPIHLFLLEKVGKWNFEKRKIRDMNQKNYLEETKEPKDIVDVLGRVPLQIC